MKEAHLCLAIATSLAFSFPVIASPPKHVSSGRSVLKEDFDNPNGLAVSNMRKAIAVLSQKFQDEAYRSSDQGKKDYQIVSKATLLQMTNCMKKYALKYSRSNERVEYLTEMAYQSCKFWESVVLDALSLGLPYRFDRNVYERMLLSEMKRVTSTAVLDSRVRR